MLRTLYKIAQVGIVTEPAKTYSDPEREALGAELKRAIDKRFNGALAIRQVDAGACNGGEWKSTRSTTPFTTWSAPGRTSSPRPTTTPICSPSPAPSPARRSTPCGPPTNARPAPSGWWRWGPAPNGGEFGES